MSACGEAPALRRDRYTASAETEKKNRVTIRRSTMRTGTVYSELCFFSGSFLKTVFAA
jgi:hypothetical protein